MYPNNPLYRVWYKEYDENGNEIGEGVSPKEYKTYGHANNYGYKHFGDRKRFKFVVAYRNPFVKYTHTEPCGICGRDVEMEETHMGYVLRDNQIIISKRKDYAKYRHFTCCEDCFNKLMEFVDENKEDNDD